MEAFAVAFAVVFVAELGDKTQLVAMSLAARYRTITVLAGITIAYAITNGISVLVGGLLGAALPTTAISVAGAIAFFGFAIWTLRDDEDDDDEAEQIGGRSVLMSIIGAMVFAELGDKTMLATATLAARGSPLLTWAGATLGITASGALAVAVGSVLGDRLPRRTIRIAAAALFALFGVLLLVDALRVIRRARRGCSERRRPRARSWGYTHTSSVDAQGATVWPVEASMIVRSPSGSCNVTTSTSAQSPL